MYSDVERYFKCCSIIYHVLYDPRSNTKVYPLQSDFWGCYRLVSRAMVIENQVKMIYWTITVLKTAFMKMGFYGDIANTISVV